MKYLLTGTEMKAWEKKAMDRYKIPSILLMERAAKSVVSELICGDYDLHKVLVICGNGNNGGDGLAVARMLLMRGISVDVCMASSVGGMTKETDQQWKMYLALSGSVVTVPVFDEYTVIVDGILGIGCNREIAGRIAELVEGMNRVKAKIVAIDIPTGVSSDSGKICKTAVKADTTITFFAKKLGMVLYPGAEYCGVIKVEDLELPFEPTEECKIISFSEEDLQLLPKRSADSHKGNCGKVLVIAGCAQIFGAAYLAASAAYRIGAGLVKVFTSKENKISMQTLLPEALLDVYDGGDPADRCEGQWKNLLNRSMDWADVIVIGPGLGVDQTSEDILKEVLRKTKVPLVIDADGINLLAKNRELLKKCHVPMVLTPHILEMARLCSVEREELLKSTISAAKNFVEEYPVTLVLKDARTVVAAKEELVYINTSGNSGMSTGGSGDVLAGVIGGLMAQGMKAIEAARLGVFLHGKAGDLAKNNKGIYSMTATDILTGIAEVTK